MVHIPKLRQFKLIKYVSQQASFWKEEIGLKSRGKNCLCAHLEMCHPQEDTDLENTFLFKHFFHMQKPSLENLLKVQDLETKSISGPDRGTVTSAPL